MVHSGEAMGFYGVMLTPLRSVVRRERWGSAGVRGGMLGVWKTY